jgi:Zn-finger nucleic acid-binding protein
MPLLVSPIDGQTPMQPIKRDGIEIDRCPVSGGVWLDRGELEKLLAAVQAAVQEDRSQFAEYTRAQPNAPQQATAQHGRGYDDDDFEHYRHNKYGKKSKLKSLFDMFD